MAKIYVYSVTLHHLILVVLFLPAFPKFPMDSVPNNSPPTKRTKALQWNCRNIKTNFDQFYQYLHSFQEAPSIISLQSLSVCKGNLPVIQGYYFPQFYSTENDKVRTATYIRKTLQASHIRLPAEVPGNACEISLSNKDTLKVINVYFPKGCSKPEDTRWMTNLGSGNWLVMGDFNAHHPMWEGPGSRTTGSGNLLADYIIQSDLCLLNNGAPTRFPDHNGQKPTAIDISLITSHMYASAHWEVHDDPLGSDHCPIIIKIDHVECQRNVNCASNYNYSKADWSLFVSTLEDAEYSSDNLTLDEQYEKLRYIITEAADKSIPKKQSSKYYRHPSNPWWNEECSNAVKRKRKDFTAYKRRQSEENYAKVRESRILCKRTIAEAKRIYWESYINENIHDYKDAKTLWKKIKSIKQQYCPADQPLLVNGIRIRTESEKAESHAEVFARAGLTESLPPDIRQFRQNQEINFLDPPSDPSSPLNAGFSLRELIRCIEQVKNVKKSHRN